MVESLCYVGLLSTVYMTGVVWFAQWVHYPLISRGDAAEFARFAHEYQRRTLWVVTPALVGEVLTAVGLVWYWPSSPTWSGLLVLIGIWGLTCRYQIPQHLELKRSGYSPDVHRDLVRYNFPRAVLWTIRSLILVWTAYTLPVR